MDRSFAVKITIEHFFEPLYRDYSIIGRMLGILFRSIRVVAGTIIYVVITVFFAVVYVIWIMILPALLFFSVRKT